MLLCGDFNSTPKSPLLKFLLDSNLDYANLSALVIAGYFEGGARKRVIPVPLLPKDMNIGPDCTYIQREEVDITLIQGSESTETGTGSAGKGSEKQEVPHTQQSEFTSMDLEVNSESKSMRTTRSIRGAKGKGRRANLSDFPSLVGSSLCATKRGRGEDWSIAEALKSSPSGGSSVDGSLLGDGDGGRDTSGRSQSRASCNEDGAGDSLESSVNSVSTKNPAPSSGSGGTSVGVVSKDAVAKHNAGGVQTGVLTHPFKLITAYPISKRHPSTVTTYHQCAFETVDYILFSPISCGSSGSRKNLTGFNLLKRKVLPSTHTLLDLGPQPHQFLSSDHLLLQATLQFSW